MRSTVAPPCTDPETDPIGTVRAQHPARDSPPRRHTHKLHKVANRQQPRAIPSPQRPVSSRSRAELLSQIRAPAPITTSGAAVTDIFDVRQDHSTEPTRTGSSRSPTAVTHGPRRSSPAPRFTEWVDMFSAEVLASAIIDRLLHDGEVFAIHGPSYRLKGRFTGRSARDGLNWPHLADIFRCRSTTSATRSTASRAQPWVSHSDAPSQVETDARLWFRGFRG